MKGNYLLVSDFDGTIAETFEPSPNHIGTHEAYELSIEAVFGEDAVDTYRKAGGLRNRAPIEVVQEILQKEPKLLQKAWETFCSNFNFLQHPIPMIWNEQMPIATVTEMLVRFKLMFLLQEIGEYWPKPCTGVLDFFETLNKISKDGSDIKLALGILSSGHTMFIQKTFSAWRVPCPEIIVTDDNIRGRYPIEVSKKVKPHPFTFALIHYNWLKRNHTNGDIFLWAKESRRRMVYFGDDPAKDGILANNVGIPFGWFNPAKKSSSNDFSKGSFNFSDWGKVAKFVIENSKLFSSGMPCCEIFSLLK